MVAARCRRWAVVALACTAAARVRVGEPRRLALRGTPRRAWLHAAALSLVVSRPAATRASRGAPDTLARIAAYDAAVSAAVVAADGSDLERCAAALSRVPESEGAFKATFDAFSEAKSFLTEYKDKNAFLIGLTSGYDGPGRARMGTLEEIDPQAELQAEQYGLRNDAWAALDDARATLRFLRAAGGPRTDEDVRDLADALRRAQSALGAYLALAPEAAVQEARRRSTGDEG